MRIEDLKDRFFIGIVEDNLDPKRIGRVKIRIPFVFGDISTDDLPWAKPEKDPNGNQFIIPEVGKVVNVIFEDGNPYKPEYISAEHYNINLEEKLKDITEEDYKLFRSVLFDGSTQIYRNKTEGLKIDHEYTNINITENGDLNLNLRDNNSKLNLGSEDSTQSVILGTNFIDWMDRFVDYMLTNTAFLGNLQAPIISTPGFIDLLTEYKNSRTTKFLSDNVWVVDNKEVKEQERLYINQTGDSWSSTISSNSLSKREQPPYIPEKRPETGRPVIKGANIPNDILSDSINEAGIQTVNVSNYENGKIPLSKMKKNKFLSLNLDGDSSYLMIEASDALDRMMQDYNASNFSGKQTVVFTDGYRTFERQQALFRKYGSGRAAIPGRSNHGWGIAIDMYWGVRTSMYKNQNKRQSAYKHPVYVWFFENGWKYGWFNPNSFRDDLRTEEWWHWEFYGPGAKPTILSSRYSGPFEDIDISNIRSEGGSFKV